MKLTAITGPMFAGKSAMLLKRISSALENDLRVLGVKPAIDTRQPGLIKSRNGAKFNAQEIPTTGLFEIPHGVDLLVIDEAHMFERYLTYSVKMALAQGTEVVVAGVDYNSHLRPFMTMQALIAASHDLIRLYAKCKNCRQPAPYTLRVIESEAEIVVGDECYEPYCPTCFHGIHINTDLLLKF